MMTTQEKPKFTYSDWQEIGQKFFDIFHVSSTKFLDYEMMMLFNRPTINIFKFDEWLSNKYPDDKNISIRDNVLKHYGQEGADLIEMLI